jgi:hypothetical protein
MLNFACISGSPVQHAGDVLSEVHLGIVLGFVTDHSRTLVMLQKVRALLETP